MKKSIAIGVLLMCSVLNLKAQSNDSNHYTVDSLEFTGMLMGFSNFTPESQYNFWTGARYIPELEYTHKFNKKSALTFDVALNFYGSAEYNNFTSGELDGSIEPYRGWVRYNYGLTEVRVGLQNIDFGSSNFLRPIQWFNQVDPRDPLQLSNGVYSALGRHYFKNNANLWFWVLYGNEDRRGYDAFGSDKTVPEFGGRFQYPTKKGEIAFTYHHRDSEFKYGDYSETSPENRIALDGKWDLGVGFWFEFSYVNQKDPYTFELDGVSADMLTNQTLFDVGTDYTFGIGNGLTASIEHLTAVYGKKWDEADEISNLTALSGSYPIGFNDNLTAYATYSWEANLASYFLSYSHMFRTFTGYTMIYYTPEVEDAGASAVFMNSEYSQTQPGFGLRLMVVFNH